MVEENLSGEKNQQAPGNRRANRIIYACFFILLAWAVGFATWKYLIAGDFLVTTTPDQSITYNFAKDQNILAPMIEACQWAPTKSLFFSKNVFPDTVYPFHFVPLILVGFLGIFVLAHDHRQLANKTFFAASLFFCSWILLDLLLWASASAQMIMFLWSLLMHIEPLIYASLWYLAYQKYYTKKIPTKLAAQFLILMIPNLVLGNTFFGLIAFDLAECEREAIEGPLVYYRYFVQLLMALAIAGFAMRNKPSEPPSEKRLEANLLAMGTCALLLLLTLGLVVGSITRDWAISNYGLIGAPIFFSFIAYGIIRFRAFQIKITGGIAMIFAIWGFVVSIAFVDQLNLMYYISAGSLLFAGLLGIFADTELRR